MKTIELDLTGCQYLTEIHERIRIAFDFPEYYGKNWSAFWDFLWSECNADKVIIKGEGNLSREFDQSLIKLHEILERNISFRKDNKLNPFSFEIIN